MSRPVRYQPTIRDRAAVPVVNAVARLLLTPAFVAALQRLVHGAFAVQQIHQPRDTPDDPWVTRRCTGCIAGYDPSTGELVPSAWPCSTIKALGGDE